MFGNSSVHYSMCFVLSRDSLKYTQCLCSVRELENRVATLQEENRVTQLRRYTCASCCSCFNLNNLCCNLCMYHISEWSAECVSIETSNWATQSSTYVIVTLEKLVRFLLGVRSNSAKRIVATAVLSICPSHAGTLSRGMKIESCGLHCEVAKLCSFLTPTMVWGRRPLPREICTQSDPPPLKSADLDQYLLNVSTVTAFLHR